MQRLNMVIHSIEEISNGRLNKFSKFDKIYDFFNGKELSSDFIFTNYNEDNQYKELIGDYSNKFFVFATTGQGDLWLFDKEDQEIYYYNHDTENVSFSNFINLDFDIYKWLIVADLFKQIDNLSESDTLTEKDQETFKDMIKKIAPKLLEIFDLGI